MAGSNVQRVSWKSVPLSFSSKSYLATKRPSILLCRRITLTLVYDQTFNSLKIGLSTYCNQPECRISMNFTAYT
ncbi:hypothetical protein HOV93_06450 [Planctomycetes bacterium FF15]|uniref:Uncharacterized protein n=1 Tax=Bremerella alba TaxID=980252 RepID=A0A7V9A621_9BACT|nr:hypothetical protein [Bremerella alba]